MSNRSKNILATVAVVGIAAIASSPRLIGPAAQTQVAVAAQSASLTTDAYNR